MDAWKDIHSLVFGIYIESTFYEFSLAISFLVSYQVSGIVKH